MSIVLFISLSRSTYTIILVQPSCQVKANCYHLGCVHLRKIFFPTEFFLQEDCGIIRQHENGHLSSLLSYQQAQGYCSIIRFFREENTLLNVVGGETLTIHLWHRYQTFPLLFNTPKYHQRFFFPKFIWCQSKQFTIKSIKEKPT